MLDVTALTKIYDTDQGEVLAVNSISFQVEDGEFLTLLGPSGCGKTTTLRCTAGLEVPDGGEISIGGRIVFSHAKRINVPVDRRDIGIVFQSYAIWPHMSVFANVAFPLQTERRAKAGEVRRKVEESLRMVRMEEFIDRPAPQLSGGQQQRVALARALVKRPKLLLLDEPLSNLDAKLREETRLEIKDLVDNLGITVLYVTHDQAEALSMSDRILVMGDGDVLQEGTPLEIYQNPQSEFVASFIGSANLIQGKLTDRTEDSGNIETSSGRLICRLSSGLQAGDPVLVSMRPEEVRVLKEKPQVGNVLPGTVRKLTFFGDWLECRTQVDSATIRAKLHPDATFQEGQTVFLEIPEDKCLAIPFAAKRTVK